MLLGVFSAASAPVPGALTLVKELSWIGAMAYGSQSGVRDLDEAAALLAAAPDVRDTIMTHRFSLEESPEAFRRRCFPIRRFHQGGPVPLGRRAAHGPRPRAQVSLANNRR